MQVNTEQMQLPPFLWVPFEPGHPFGAPQNIDIYPNGAPEGAPVMYFGG